MNRINLKVDENSAGKRLDLFISACDTVDLTRSAAAKLCDDGKVNVNGKIQKKNFILRIGDEISIDLPEPVPDKAEPQDISLDVVYEDNDIIVINKPQGMVVHPAAGNHDGTLVNALLYHCKDSLSGIGGIMRPGIVHRIDKDTAGLLVVAKNDEAHLFLSELLKDHTVNRIYYAIVLGNFKEDNGKIDLPIGRNPNDRKKMAVIKDWKAHSRNAVTHWSVLERFNGFSLIRCKLETGRTHQIRVHMANMGHPILGDELYGGNKTKFEEKHKDLIHGQCLFSGELNLIHPVTKENMTFRADYPKNFSAILEILRKQGN